MLLMLTRALRFFPVLIWLIGQIAMLAGTSVTAKEAQPKSPFPFDRIVLCTPDGPQEVGDENQPLTEKNCKWCQAFGNVTLTPANWECVPWKLALEPTTHWTEVGFAPLAAPREVYSSRAPPALAFL